MKKMKNIEIKEAEYLFNDIVKTCQKNINFKEDLIKNPKKVIYKKYGLKLKPNQKCVVEDQTDNSIMYLNIPKVYNIQELELTDEELETISGGSTFWCGAILGGLLYDGVKAFTRGVEDGYNGVDNF